MNDAVNSALATQTASGGGFKVNKTQTIITVVAFTAVFGVITYFVSNKRDMTKAPILHGDGIKILPSVLMGLLGASIGLGVDALAQKKMQG